MFTSILQQMLFLANGLALSCVHNFSVHEHNKQNMLEITGLYVNLFKTNYLIAWAAAL